MATSSSLVSSSGALLTVQQFSCSLPDGTELIECSSCSLGAGVFALTGENGSGKSTFLNACGGSAGDLSYDGRIYAAGRRLLIGQQCASPIADELNLRHSLLALQAVADGCYAEQTLLQCDGLWTLVDDCVACLAESGVTPFGGNQPVITPATLLYWLDQQLPFLSGGERQKVRLALAFSLQPQVLLLDEPGNDLDSAGRAWLAGKLTAWRGCVLLVSHQPALLRSADGILELSGRQIKYYGTGYDDYLLIRQQEQQAQQQRLDHLRPADHAQSTVAAES